jgi:hypothetical protein
MGFWSDITGKTAADASRRAADDTYRKQTEAVGDLKRYGDTLPGAYAGLADQFSPYANAGGSALARLLGGLGLEGGDGEDFSAAYRALPGYQAGREAGNDAVMQTAGARGMLNSGRTMKDLYRFGSDYEDKRSGDYMSRLAGLAGMGQTATGQQVATEGTGLQGQLQTRMGAYGGQYGSAGTIGQGDIAAANAMAAGSGNLLNAGMKVGGMLLGAAGGMPGMGGGGMSPFASGAAGGSGNGSMFPSSSWLSGGFGF